MVSQQWDLRAFLIIMMMMMLIIIGYFEVLLHPFQVTLTVRSPWKRHREESLVGLALQPLYFVRARGQLAQSSAQAAMWHAGWGH